MILSKINLVFNALNFRDHTFTELAVAFLSQQGLNQRRIERTIAYQFDLFGRDLDEAVFFQRSPDTFEQVKHIHVERFAEGWTVQFEAEEIAPDQRDHEIFAGMSKAA